MNEPADQLPPYDAEAEAGALSCVLCANGEADQLFESLDLELFYEERHRTIYGGLHSLHVTGKSLDPISLEQWLKDRKQIEAAGGKDYVAALPDVTHSPAYFPAYLETLQDRTIRRAAIRDAVEIERLARNPAIPARLLGEASKRMGEAHSNHKAAGFTIRKPSEFLEMRFDDSDIILGDRLAAVGQSLVIAAAGGTGKSRLLLQIAACVTTGRKFLSFDTGGSSLRWLILQTENSNRRLKADLTRLREWLGDDWVKFDEQVRIHAVENDTDGFVSLADPENVANIEAAIAEHKADIIGADPLNDFAIGDLNKDADMKATLQALSRICRKGNPHRLIIALHHAITGRSGSAKATGYDRASFARNSKVLHAWSRGQINLAPVDPETNDRLIVACGKCSNGREFLPFGIKLNPETMLYECDPTVDVKAWEAEMSSKGNNEPLMTPARVKELCGLPKTKAELARAIREDCGCVRQVSYKYIKRAEQARKIRFNTRNETYCAN